MFRVYSPFVLIVGLGLGGCSLVVDFDPALLPDGGRDAGADGSVDAGVDGAVDAGTEAAEDGDADAG